MTDEELKRLRQLAGRMYDAKPLDYECEVTYPLTEPAEPVYAMRDEHGDVIAWAHSVAALIRSIESILPTGEELPK